MREGKISVTVYPTSTEGFGFCRIYGDHVLVISSEEYTNRAFIYSPTPLRKIRTSPSYEQVLLTHDALCSPASEITGRFCGSTSALHVFVAICKPSVLGVYNNAYLLSGVSCCTARTQR